MITLPVGDPPPYSKHQEQGIPVSLQQGSHEPAILNLLRVIQERNKILLPTQWNYIGTVPQNGKSTSPGGLEIVSVHSDDTTSMKGGPSENQKKSLKNH